MLMRVYSRYKVLVHFTSHPSFKVHRLKAKSNVPRHNELNPVDHLYTAKHTFKHILYYSTSLVCTGKLTFLNCKYV